MTAVTPAPGDFIFVRSSGVIGWAIRLGERLRFRPGDFWNHCALVSDATCKTHNSPKVIQAVARGVTDVSCLATVAPGGSYEVVKVPTGVDATKVLAFAKMQVGCEYGYLSIVSIVLRILLPKWFPLPTIRSRSTWICSALAAECARAGGWLHNWSDLFDTVPSEFYAALHGMSVEQLSEILRAV